MTCRASARSEDYPLEIHLLNCLCCVTALLCQDLPHGCSRHKLRHFILSTPDLCHLCPKLDQHIPSLPSEAKSHPRKTQVHPLRKMGLDHHKLPSVSDIFSTLFFFAPSPSPVPLPPPWLAFISLCSAACYIFSSLCCLEEMGGVTIQRVKVLGIVRHCAILPPLLNPRETHAVFMPEAGEWKNTILETNAGCSCRPLLSLTTQPIKFFEGKPTRYYERPVRQFQPPQLRALSRSPRFPTGTGVPENSWNGGVAACFYCKGMRWRGKRLVVELRVKCWG